MINSIIRNDIHKMNEETRRAIDETFNGFDFESNGWEFYPEQTMGSLKIEWADAIAEMEEDGGGFEGWEHYTEIPGHGVIWTI